MKKILLLLAGVAIIATTSAQMSSKKSDFEGAKISNVELRRSGEMLRITMNVELGSKHMRTNCATIYTPVLYNASNEIALQSVGVYGRNHYYAMLRDEKHHSSVPLDWQLRHKDLPAEIDYVAEVEYEPWMNGASLSLVEQAYGCYNELLAVGDIIVGEYSEPTIVPTYLFILPERVESGVEHCARTAHVDFPVNVATIDPNFNSNRQEIAIIDNNLDSLRTNANVVITKVVVRGSASPEGGQLFNAELAEERAAALVKHIREHYNVPGSVLTTLYETNQWADVRAWVEQSNLANRSGVVKLLSSNVAPDRLNTMLMEQFPEEYEHILTQFYPSLRRAEYDIEYDVKSYEDIERIVAVAISSPATLSANDLTAAATQLDESSPEFDNVLLTIVAKIPNDTTANINAANVAMRRGELRHAERYLSRAGNSAEADYARALYALHQGDYGEARRLLKHVEGKVAHASKLLAKMTQLGL